MRGKYLSFLRTAEAHVGSDLIRALNGTPETTGLGQRIVQELVSVSISVGGLALVRKVHGLPEGCYVQGHFHANCLLQSTFMCSWSIRIFCQPLVPGESAELGSCPGCHHPNGICLLRWWLSTVAQPYTVLASLRVTATVIPGKGSQDEPEGTGCLENL